MKFVVCCGCLSCFGNGNCSLTLSFSFSLVLTFWSWTKHGMSLVHSTCVIVFFTNFRYVVQYYHLYMWTFYCFDTGYYCCLALFLFLSFSLSLSHTLSLSSHAWPASHAAQMWKTREHGNIGCGQHCSSPPLFFIRLGEPGDEAIWIIVYAVSCMWFILFIISIYSIIR